MIKDKKPFDKYLKIWEKTQQYNKKKRFNSELIHNGKYLKAKKHQHKRNLLMFLYK